MVIQDMGIRFCGTCPTGVVNKAKYYTRKPPGGVLGGLSFSHIRGSPVGFPGSGIWLISRPGFGILKEQGARSGIVIMPGTRDLALLTSGNREMSL